jgi:hypothetical protein
MNRQAPIRPTCEPIADPGVVWDSASADTLFLAIVERM